MAGKLEITTRDEDGYRVVKVVGDVDLDSSPRLQNAVRHALRGTGCLKVDLRDVHYVDSSGIAVLVQGQRWARRKQVDYRLLDPSPQVRAVIELSQLDRLFSIETTGIEA